MDWFEQCKEHVVSRINETSVASVPFRHTYIEKILPEKFYDELKELSIACKSSNKLKIRPQDSKQYLNSRYNFMDEHHPVIDTLRKVFSDTDVKQAFLSKFFLNNVRSLAETLDIHHDEFEFTFTSPNRFQNIHIDIPPKYLSLVFYLPEGNISEEEECQNATLFYDEDMQPSYDARYKDNSVGAFAPHFSSYHGNATTIDRTAIVLFYVNKQELADWNKDKIIDDKPPFNLFKDYTQKKLEKHVMIEYEGSKEKILSAREKCKINAPRGRYIQN